MYKIIDESGAIYTQHTYTREADFERMIVDHTKEVFGPEGIYFDIKKLIGTPKKGATIPDGYFLDLTFHNDPKLYLVEVELNSHDVYGHADTGTANPLPPAQGAVFQIGAFCRYSPG